MAKKKAATNWLHETTLRVCRVHFAYIAAYALAIIIFDSWNLITREVVSQRWTMATIMLVINTLLWYSVRFNGADNKRYFAIFSLLITADIWFASWNVLNQRGMASKAVMMFAVPIISSALLRSRSTLLATTTLSVAGYALAAVRYFNAHYGEGYRVELYGEVFFYSALMFVFAWLLLIIIQPKTN